MSNIRIVIDTNVLVAALRSRRGPSFRLLSRVGDGSFDVCLSVPLLFEYEDVLSREPIGVEQAAAEAVLNYVCRVAIAQDVYYLWRPILPDPKDDLVLELAVAARSSRIVTYNIRDFAGSERFNVRAVRPAGFLLESGEKS
jgi:putative PIN family toxin of toxin-antitoxin system